MQHRGLENPGNLPICIPENTELPQPKIRVYDPSHIWPTHNQDNPYMTHLYDPYMTHVRVMYRSWLCKLWVIYGLSWSCMGHIRDGSYGSYWSCMGQPWVIYMGYMGHVCFIPGSYIGYMGHLWANHGSYELYVGHAWIIQVIHGSCMGHMWVMNGRSYRSYVWVIQVVQGSCMGHVWVICWS